MSEAFKQLQQLVTRDGDNLEEFTAALKNFTPAELQPLTIIIAEIGALQYLRALVKHGVHNIPCSVVTISVRHGHTHLLRYLLRGQTSQQQRYLLQKVEFNDIFAGLDQDTSGKYIYAMKWLVTNFEHALRFADIDYLQCFLYSVRNHHLDLTCWILANKKLSHQDIFPIYPSNVLVAYYYAACSGNLSICQAILAYIDSPNVRRQLLEEVVDDSLGFLQGLIDVSKLTRQSVVQCISENKEHFLAQAKRAHNIINSYKISYTDIASLYSAVLSLGFTGEIDYLASDIVRAIDENLPQELSHMIKGYLLEQKFSNESLQIIDDIMSGRAHDLVAIQQPITLGMCQKFSLRIFAAPEIEPESTELTFLKLLDAVLMNKVVAYAPVTPRTSFRERIREEGAGPKLRANTM
jgi:hypothetical protein